MRRLCLLAGLVAASAPVVAQPGGRSTNPLAQYLRTDTAVIAIRNVRVIDGTGAPPSSQGMRSSSMAPGSR